MNSLIAEAKRALNESQMFPLTEAAAKELIASIDYAKAIRRGLPEGHVAPDGVSMRTPIGKIVTYETYGAGDAHEDGRVVYKDRTWGVVCARGDAFIGYLKTRFAK
jgi:hypothetical protein